MRSISYREFQDMVRSSGRAWHLELRDSYHVEQEDVPFARWLRGESDDYAWLAEWLSFVREVTRHGVAVQRLRVVTVPHSDYTRWSLEVARLNTGSGEDVRYLPRHEAGDFAFPSEDCWLLDDDRLVLSLFRPDGRSDGFVATEDVRLVARYRAARDIQWPRAVPYREYAVR